MKTAICNVADTGPLESLAIMLRCIGYRIMLPSREVKQELRRIGCDTVLDVDNLVKGWGYDPPMALPDATLSDMETCDLFVDLKAHRNGVKIWGRWPRLRDRTLWYRINGGKPEHVIKSDGEDCGDECNPPCPILTPDLWYRGEGPWNARAYAVWPPFYRFDEYYPVHRRPTAYSAPVCLTHNLAGWGYGALLDHMRELGVKCYGAGSPDGLISHRDVPLLLSQSLALVHLKSSDAPGYSLYEALAAGCPVVCTRRLIWRNKMEDLLIPNETCLVFDRETHDGLSDDDVRVCTEEVTRHLTRLRHPDINARIGMAGRERLKELMWDEIRDSTSLLDFMQRNYP